MRIKDHDLFLKKRFFKFVYYNFAIYLPRGTNKYFGWLGKSVKRFVCKYLFEYCGKNVNVERGARFGNGFHIRLGDNSGFWVDCVIPDGSIIGENVMMGPNCYIHARNHAFDRIDIPMMQQRYAKSKPIIIDDDVWIGRDVVIMVGHHISKGTIIPANCVLTKDFPEYSGLEGIRAS